MGGGEVTFKSDIYSFGLVLAEAARGRPLDMNGSQADVVEKRRSVPDISGVDRTIRPLIHAMLEPLPDKRPSSMAAVAEWGESSRAAAARRASLQEDEAPLRESAGGRLAAILGALIAVISLAAVGYVFRGDLAQWIEPRVAPTQKTPVAGPPPLAEPSKPAATTAALPPLAPATPSETAPPPQPPAVVTENPPQIVTLPLRYACAARGGPPGAAHPDNRGLVAAAAPRAPRTVVELPPATVATPYRAELPAFSDHSGKGLRLAATPCLRASPSRISATARASSGERRSRRAQSRRELPPPITPARRHK